MNVVIKVFDDYGGYLQFNVQVSLGKYTETTTNAFISLWYWIPAAHQNYFFLFI